MRTKFTILMCALLVLGLAVSQAHAQYSYSVGKIHQEVAQHGHNQEVGVVFLRNRTEAQAQASDVIRNQSDDKVTISIDGLAVNNAAGTDTGDIMVQCGTGLDITTDFAACDAGTTLAADDKKTMLTLTVASGDTSDNIAISGIRVDVSGLDADAEVMAKVSSGGSGTVDFGTGAGVSSSVMVAMVKAGITVDVTHASRLYCSDTGAGMPSVKVGEGFASAWEAESETGIGNTQVKLKILNVPSGITFVWPGQEHDDAMSAPVIMADLRDTPTESADDDTEIARLTFVPAGLSTDTTEAVYEFTPTDRAADSVDFDGDDIADTHEATAEHAKRSDTFELPLVVKVDAAKAGAGGTADLWAWLHPQPGFEDLDTKLSYKMAPTTEDTNDDKVIDEEDGDILTVSECVTYLLYPFVTCGSTAGWSTGISVANTSMDDDVFGEKMGAAPQGGSVTLYGYPKSAKASDGSSGEMMDPVMMMLSPNLASGDTIAAPCPMVMEGGWEGYAIVRAGFRHAHGLAFVLGDMDGGGLDVAHGYMALVIPDPEFNEGVRGTEISESLGQ